VLIIGSAGISWIAYERVFASFLQNVIDIDYVKFNMRLGGGYPVVRSEILVVSVVRMLSFLQARRHEKSPKQMPFVFAFSLLTPWLVLLVASYLSSPYAPQYGVIKYGYMIAGVAAPYALAAIAGQFSMGRSQMNGGAVAFGLLLTFLWLGSPGDKIQWLQTAQTVDVPWAQAVVAELRNDPQRPVVCLNTVEDDTSRNYEAYLCSRIALGLGGFNEIVHRTWTAANICQVPAKQADEAFTDEFQKNLTVVLFDPSEVTSGVECQAPTESHPRGWTSAIDWKVVKTVDEGGSRVFPPTPEELSDGRRIE